MTHYSVTAAVAIGRERQESLHPQHDYTDECLVSVRTALGIPALYPTARAAWSYVPVARRHAHTVPPPGTPCFFQTSNSAWHITLADVHPWWVWSSDIKRKGKIDLVSKDLIESRWGASWLGWTELLNDWWIPNLDLTKLTPAA
jgi:hypothetical protein